MVRLLLALLIAFVVLNLAGVIAMSVNKGMQLTPDQQWIIPVVMQSGLLIFAFILIVVFSKGELGSHGFAKPTKFKIMPLVILSLVVGSVAAVILAFLPGSQHPLEKMFSPLQVIVFVWIYAPICEEVLFRGLLQTFLSPLAHRGFIVGQRRISIPVIAAAVLFGLMHLSLLQAGMSLLPVIVIVVFGFVLGIFAGYYREQTSSLLPAILVHSLFNISGTIVGWLTPAAS